jgi:glycosyltransferase involved in cell wall biosynthesis
MSDLPLVSIIVPCYNHEKYVEQCIESIVNQTYKNIQLIVIDDGSKDKSPEILRQLQKKYGFILECQKNIGLACTLNRGIKEFAQGKYVTFCASDDYWCTTKLEKQICFMEANPDTPMCYGKMYAIKDNKNIDKHYSSKINENLKGGFIFKEILTQKFHPPVSYLCRKDVFSQIGYYPEGCLAEDFYMNCTISEHYKIGYIDDYLAYYRILMKPQRLIYVAYSHLETIEKFKHSPYYRKAKLMWYLKFLNWFGGDMKYKKLALIACLKGCPFFWKKLYIRGIIKLILLWR